MLTCLRNSDDGIKGTYPVFNFNQGGERITCLEMAGPPVATDGSNTRFAPHESDHTILNPGDMWWWMEGQAWLSAAKLFDHYLVSTPHRHFVN